MEILAGDEISNSYSIDRIRETVKADPDSTIDNVHIATSVAESQPIDDGDSNSSIRIDPTLPAFLREAKLLVPIKIDLTYGGARFVDSFCWNLYGNLMTPYKFAAITCSDLNLPIVFEARIALQIAEQLESFSEIVSLAKISITNQILPNVDKVCQVMPMAITVRYNTVEYTEKIIWDLMSDDVTPEVFSRKVCADLGLPAAIEPVIAFRIRDNLFRHLISWLEDPDNFEAPAPGKISEPKVTLVPPAQVTEMAANLWKRARPNTAEDQAYVPLPMMPDDKDTNASIWA